MPALRFTKGPLAGERIQLEGDVVLGREYADIVLPDEEVSRRHATLRVIDEGIEIEDLGSTNGTWLNEVRTTRPTSLIGGDSVRIGRSVFEVELDAGVADLSVVRSAPAATVVVSREGPRVTGKNTTLPETDFEPFGAYLSDSGTGSRRRPTSRRIGAVVFSLVVVVATAVALVAYFALR